MTAIGGPRPIGLAGILGGGGAGFEQAAVGVLAQPVDGEHAFGEAERGGEIAGFGGLGGEAGEGFEHGVFETGAGQRQPLVEIGGDRGKAGEQRAGVGGGGGEPVGGIAVGREAQQGGGVENDVVGQRQRAVTRQDDVARRDLFAQVGERLAQGVAHLLGAAVGPEQFADGLAGGGTGTLQGKEGEQGAGFARQGGRRIGADREREATENIQAQGSRFTHDAIHSS